MWSLLQLRSLLELLTLVNCFVFLVNWFASVSFLFSPPIIVDNKNAAVFLVDNWGPWWLNVKMSNEKKIKNGFLWLLAILHVNYLELATNLDDNYLWFICNAKWCKNKFLKSNASIMSFRAVARSENLGGHIVLGGDNVPPLVEIGHRSEIPLRTFWIWTVLALE